MNLSKRTSKNSTLTLVLLISVGLHVLALVIFGAFKIVETVTREDQTFEAPEIVEAPQEQPEYQVNLEQRNQSSAPPRPTPIVVDAPEVTIPALDIDVDIANTSSYGRGSGGFGTGSGSGISTMREMALEISNFGYSSFVDNTLEGTLFDFKTDDRGKPTGFEPYENIPEISKDFTRSFNIPALKRKFFSADKNLYASYFIIPFQDASNAPRAFDAEGIIEPRMIGAAYQGVYTPSKTGRFRFYGRGDDILIVRVNNRIVLDASWTLNLYSRESVDEKDPSHYGENLFGFPKPGVYGDWFNLKEGQETEIEIFICEVPGGKFGAWLMIEKAGSNSGPKIFHTRPLSQDDRDFLKQVHSDAEKFLP